MKERIYLMDLYSYYGELFTDKQKEYFEDYYYNNLTLAEISENNGVSRAAAHKAIKEIESKLNYYESTLKLYQKVTKLKKEIKDEKLLEQILKVLDY